MNTPKFYRLAATTCRGLQLDSATRSSIDTMHRTAIAQARNDRDKMVERSRYAHFLLDCAHHTSNLREAYYMRNRALLELDKVLAYCRSCNMRNRTTLARWENDARQLLLRHSPTRQSA